MTNFYCYNVNLKIFLSNENTDKKKQIFQLSFLLKKLKKTQNRNDGLKINS